jgi:hypothetical protein
MPFSWPFKSPFPHCAPSCSNSLHLLPPSHLQLISAPLGSFSIALLVSFLGPYPSPPQRDFSLVLPPVLFLSPLRLYSKRPSHHVRRLSNALVPPSPGAAPTPEPLPDPGPPSPPVAALHPSFPVLPLQWGPLTGGRSKWCRRSCPR